jgi:hypothetical protein
VEKTCLLAVALLCGLSWMTPADGATVYNNLTPNNQMAIASRPGSTGSFEIEAADDFILSSSSLITSASFVGLVVGGATSPSIADMVLEMYRVFPLDSDPTRTPNVPTRTNSPSDVAFDSRDASSGLTFTTTVLSNCFTALNSVQPGGINAKPNQTTLGNDSVTGQEVRFDVTLANPFSLPADHFFFIPQVSVSGGQFYWLSASRPITGSGTTPFKPDLQAWTRDAALDPDWLRVGTDIVGGTPPPTFNAAFSLEGTAVPEPANTAVAGAGLALILFGMRRKFAKSL